MKAQFKNTIIAESDNIVFVEGNHYFPPDSINMKYLKPNETTSECPWKGHANYYNVEVNSEIVKDAAWTYKEPKEGAQNIKDYVAFWKEVEVVD